MPGMLTQELDVEVQALERERSQLLARVQSLLSERSQLESTLKASQEAEEVSAFATACTILTCDAASC